ncbi:hypothetical protein ARMGADRAFT_556006 [Armillaria gallica]|uniref:Uncharacterized protein n=1 Tax=Armillaria gallica TaxID=47427 RepID=A0A2H3D8R1_ARMGA|nr:hypothetical protein ARMGADRAFT_556006 [Armillaria gallica]
MDIVMHTLRQSFRNGRAATLGLYVCGLAIHSNPSPFLPLAVTVARIHVRRLFYQTISM